MGEDGKGMGNRGRFGKYGEVKRLDRLRQSGFFYTKPKPKPDPDKRGLRCGSMKKRKDPISIRSAERGDLAFIRMLSEGVFRVYGPYEEMVLQWYASGGTDTVTALEGDRPVGFAMLGPVNREPPYPVTAELLAIAVTPGRENRGIGGLLLKTVIRRARDLDVEFTVLHTAVGNQRGRGLFEKHGFLPSSVKKGFYPEGQDALMMVRPLK